LLERVRYDDDLAGKAAQKSGGRPTYCESRYYRAIANGGQGEWLPLLVVSVGGNRHNN
jgi:hypothetical protein